MGCKKLKWSIGLSLVMVVIIATHYVDRHHVEKIEQSINTIYEDRLVAKDLVFELNLLVQEKEMAITAGDLAFFKSKNTNVNTKIAQLIKDFYATKLIPEEAKILAQLEQQLGKLKSLETQYKSGEVNITDLKHDISKIRAHLYQLSKIQLEEGRRQLFIGKKAVASVNLFTQMEVYVLLGILVLLQIGLIFKPKSKPTNFKL